MTLLRSDLAVGSMRLICLLFRRLRIAYLQSVTLHQCGIYRGKRGVTWSMLTDLYILSIARGKEGTGKWQPSLPTGLTIKYHPAMFLYGITDICILMRLNLLIFKQLYCDFDGLCDFGVRAKNRILREADTLQNYVHLFTFNNLIECAFFTRKLFTQNLCYSFGISMHLLF